MIPWIFVYLFGGICFTLASLTLPSVKRVLYRKPFSRIFYFIIVTVIWLPLLVVHLFRLLMGAENG